VLSGLLPKLAFGHKVLNCPLPCPLPALSPALFPSALPCALASALPLCPCGFLPLQFRFTLLCHAACEAPLQLELGGFADGQNVIFGADDWHAGLVPVLVASKYRKYGVYKDARTVVAIHNMWHQAHSRPPHLGTWGCRRSGTGPWSGSSPTSACTPLTRARL